MKKRELTPEELAARRRNAQLSTGPTTEPGKHRSRLNAFKHGYRASIALDAKAQSELARRLAALEYDIRPRGATERILLREMAWSSVQLDRLRDEHEAAYHRRRPEALTNWDKARADTIAGLVNYLQADDPEPIQTPGCPPLPLDPINRAAVIAQLEKTDDGCCWLADAWETIADALKSRENPQSAIPLGPISPISPISISSTPSTPSTTPDSQSAIPTSPSTSSTTPNWSLEHALWLLRLLGHSGQPPKNQTQPTYQTWLDALAVAFDDRDLRVLLLKKPRELPDPHEARHRLQTLARNQADHFGAKMDELWHADEASQRAEAQHMIATDLTDEGRLRLRYMTAASNQFHRAKRAIEKIRNSGHLCLGLDLEEPPPPNEPTAPVLPLHPSTPSTSSIPSMIPTPQSEIRNSQSAIPTSPSTPSTPHYVPNEPRIIQVPDNSQHTTITTHEDPMTTPQTPPQSAPPPPPSPQKCA
jgi:hypothetical protein